MPKIRHSTIGPTCSLPRRMSASLGHEKLHYIDLIQSYRRVSPAVKPGGPRAGTRGGSLDSLDAEGIGARNAIDRKRGPLVHRRFGDRRMPRDAAVLDEVLGFLPAASGEVAGGQLMDDDFVLRAVEVSRGALPDLRAGEGASGEKGQHGSDQCGSRAFRIVALWRVGRGAGKYKP